MTVSLHMKQFPFYFLQEEVIYVSIFLSFFFSSPLSTLQSISCFIHSVKEHANHIFCIIHTHTIPPSLFFLCFLSAHSMGMSPFSHAVSFLFFPKTYMYIKQLLVTLAHTVFSEKRKGAVFTIKLQHRVRARFLLEKTHFT